MTARAGFLCARLSLRLSRTISRMVLKISRTKTGPTFPTIATIIVVAAAAVAGSRSDWTGVRLTLSCSSIGTRSANFSSTTDLYSLEASTWSSALIQISLGFHPWTTIFAIGSQSESAAVRALELGKNLLKQPQVRSPAFTDGDYTEGPPFGQS